MGGIATHYYNTYGVAPVTGGNGSGTAFNGTSTATLIKALTDDTDKRVFTIFATQDCYIRQVGTGTDTVTTGNGAFLKANTYVPILVENGSDYLAVLRVSSDGTLHRWDHQ